MDQLAEPSGSNGHGIGLRRTVRLDCRDSRRAAALTERSQLAAYALSPLAGRLDAELFSCEGGMVKPEAEIYEHS